MADLTSLGAVKAWAKSTTTDDDVLLTRLTKQLSGAALNYLERPCLTLKTYAEMRDGAGNQRMILRNWPAVSVSSVTVNGVNVPQANTPGGVGYTLTTWDGTGAGLPQELTLLGYSFARGRNNVQVTYQAGYTLMDQPFSVMAAAPYQVAFTPAQGAWAQDDGVSYASTGAALTAVKSAPAAGQYTVAAGEDGDVVYAFSAADAGAALLVSYSFTPWALQQAVTEWVVERYRYKDRIGQKSKSLGGNETASYNIAAVPPFVGQALDGYKKFLPV